MGEPEPFGRWTLGARAQLALRVEDPAAALDLEFDAVPARGRRGRRVAVDVAANGRRLGRVSGGRPDEARTHRMRIPRGAVAPGGELLLTWRIRNATSPFERGVSADRRRLGLFVRRIALVPR